MVCIGYIWIIIRRKFPSFLVVREGKEKQDKKIKIKGERNERDNCTWN